ncbi:Uridine-cytidine kinase 2, partial [Blyttiomyces sp. JEL0837]
MEPIPISAISSTHMNHLQATDSAYSLNEPPLSVLQSTTNGTDNTSSDYVKPFLIAVAGGGSSGKKKVCEMIIERLKAKEAKKVVLIKMEDFYRELAPSEQEQVAAGDYNFDHPDAVDFKLLEHCLVELASGRPF